MVRMAEDGHSPVALKKRGKGQTSSSLRHKLPDSTCASSDPLGCCRLSSPNLEARHRPLAATSGRPVMSDRLQLSFRSSKTEILRLFPMQPPARGLQRLSPALAQSPAQCPPER